jgi:nicotinate-nucleotide adenylyltransferase
MKLGIFGGTFNPPHSGHLIIAEHVRESLALDKVLFVPCAIPPHKQDLDIVEAHHRIEMLEYAVQGNRHFVVSDLEIERGGVSYSVETLTELSRVHPHDELFLLIGMDNMSDFHTWKEPEQILRLAHVVVMARPGVQVNREKWKFAETAILCDVPEIGISSREIRKKVHDGKSIRYLVTAAVEMYIYQHQLYRDSLEK